MAASEAALILKYFGRAVSVASTPMQGQTSRLMGAASIASTMQRLSDVSSRRPVLQAHTELSSDASRALAFLQMHGSATDIHSQDSVSSTAGSYSALCQQNSSERHAGDRRYRNAGQTLQMMGVQNVANFSTQHQWLQARANLDLNAHPMIRARSGIPATHLICP